MELSWPLAEPLVKVQAGERSKEALKGAKGVACSI